MAENKKDYSYLDKWAVQPEKWLELDQNEFQVMTFRTCFLYGVSQNKKMIPVLFQIYEHLQTITNTEQRVKLLTALSATIRKSKPKAIMALFPFIQVEEEGEVIRAASQFFVNLSVLSNKEFKSGASILLELVKDAPEDRKSAYLLLGLLDINNKKVDQLVSPFKSIIGNEVKSILHNNGITL
ncbi:hypothetical protein BZG02_10415 [Labilibaculum filiforme]|uniref:HEAT repeat domain-containing protein n=1 Tax=Labilibaculum filiforme TaxID=1940526 RepID=A0A2N3HYN8_9BACT|nr:hypothetical protein [Labilibaculum filiforme]PKQ63164.1 hypothetical protein BZG02_10415 [Labilibaculum filiforme]